MYYNIKKLLILILFVLIFSTVIFAQTDNRLNGTWVFIQEGIELEFVFRNGSYDSVIDGTPVERGMYTTRDSILTLNSTHSHGNFYNEMFEFSRFESRWYSTNELTQALTPIFIEMGIPRELVDEFIKEVISESESQSFSYTIDVNTLILTNPSDRTMLVFTKRPG